MSLWCWLNGASRLSAEILFPASIGKNGVKIYIVSQIFVTRPRLSSELGFVSVRPEEWAQDMA